MTNDPLKVPLQDDPTPTTDNFAGLTKSVLQPLPDHNWVQYLVENADGANTLDAIVRGRFVFADGNRPFVSRWVDVGVDQQVGPLGFATFQVGPRLQFDEFAVFVRSNAAGQPAGALVYGTAKHNPDANAEADATPRVIVTSSTALITTPSLVDTPTGLAVTVPAPGTYIARFSGSFGQSATGNTVFASIFANGAKRTESERRRTKANGTSAQPVPFCCETAVFTAAKDDVITGQWRVTNSGGGPANVGEMHERTLTLERVA